MTKSRTVALTVLAALALAACAAGADEPSISVAQGPRGIWQEAGIGSYALTIERMCFCPDIGPYVVTVADGDVASVTRDGKDVPLDDEMLQTWPLTVEELFAVVDEAEADADDMVVEYDPDLGYPTEIAIDRMENAVDDEMTYVVRDLQVGA